MVYTGKKIPSANLLSPTLVDSSNHELITFTTVIRFS